jgi:ribosomal protein RSM22 (predicted rRNA methylase)
MQARRLQLNSALEKRISEILKDKYNIDLSAHSEQGYKRIAESILQLSDFYIRNPGLSTPWSETWCQLAYLAYYMPLNSLRCRAVFAEAQRFDFFKNVQDVVDFGSGLGSASFELKLQAPKISRFHHIENSEQAIRMHQSLIEDSPSKQDQWSAQYRGSSSGQTQESLAIFSYSLNELDTLPDWAMNTKKLILIEPSTSFQGRKLLAVRVQLLELGYSMWAPCTHQAACPLLTQSQHDWCHDRIHFAQPEWLKKIESFLPFRNSTLTFSYLVAAREPAPLARTPHTLARTTGDLLREKGKARQLICRGPEREYLAWMSRDGEPQEIPRGTLVEWPQQGVQKSNEIRVKELIQDTTLWPTLDITGPPKDN